MAKLVHNPRQMIAESMPTGHVGTKAGRQATYCIRTVDQRWLLFVWSITTAFWSISIFSCRLNTIYSSSCDSTLGFHLSLQRSSPLPQMKITATRYRNRLADEHFKLCLHLCPRKYEPPCSKLWRDMQCLASTCALGRLMKNIF